MPKRRKGKTSVGRVAKSGAEKAKEAGKFVYKHRKKIQEAVKPILAVVATASTILGKPNVPARRRKK
jgi:hypothetical protein